MSRLNRSLSAQLIADGDGLGEKLRKGTKTALETTRTFATLFADMEIRQRLVMASSVEAFRSTLLSAAKELAMDQSQWRERKASIHLSQAKEQIVG
ncbi:unnamed protein product [Strongylus vulgaris]|uniref:Uncharacterized protein n=1 Tax=Strongylus vulgaris TaxID=40348 RepID=A0A3P7J6W6_STRVU|nr:unnamed protein product [Strongylus vulgaris]